MRCKVVYKEKMVESYINMLTLSLLWILIGLLIGALANGVRPQRGAWGRRRWFYLPVVGALLALLGGWLGILLMGVLFATAMAIVVAAGGVVVYAMVKGNVM